MTLINILLLIYLLQTAHCLVCYECGVPGATSCEDAFQYDIILGVTCPTGSCVATSFVSNNGVRSMLKSCNKHGTYMCSKNQSKAMNYNTCETCTSSFCNGPLPTCAQQLRFLKQCVTSQAVYTIIICCIVALACALLCFSVKKCRDGKRVEREQRSSLIAKYYSSRTNLLFNKRPVTVEDMPYTQI